MDATSPATIAEIRRLTLLGWEIKPIAKLTKLSTRTVCRYREAVLDQIDQWADRGSDVPAPRRREGQEPAL
jgi:hypothetical protein